MPDENEPGVRELPALDVLLPLDLEGRHLPTESGEVALGALLAPRTGRSVRANMVSTLDGGATGADHVSGSINGPADGRVFRVLRALADVVLIGAGTARAEGYSALGVPDGLAGLRAANGLAPTLELAVVTRSGDLPPTLLGLDRPPLVVTRGSDPEVVARLRAELGDDRVVVAGDDEVDLAAALDHLADRGLRRVLAEGGPSLLADLLDAGLLDELFLTWSPTLVGGPALRPTRSEHWFSPAICATPAHLLHADGVLLGRWTIDPSTRVRRSRPGH